MKTMKKSLLFLVLFLMEWGVGTSSAQTTMKNPYPRHIPTVCKLIRDFCDMTVDAVREEDSETRNVLANNIASTMLEKNAVLHPDFLDKPVEDGLFAYDNYLYTFLREYSGELSDEEFSLTPSDFKLVEHVLSSEGTLQLDVEYTLTVAVGGKELYRGKSVALVNFSDVTIYLAGRIQQILPSKEYQTLAKTSQNAVQPKRKQAQPLVKRSFKVGGVTFVMLPVRGGKFKMGNSPADVSYTRTLTYDYLIGETEVTQELWEAVMGSNPSYFKGKKRPVERVSWNDCEMFIKKLQRITGARFRLPTEAEWEYAARGGATSADYRYAGGDILEDVAWYKRNSGGKTREVKKKRPNALGIYDMSGNVFEWCWDFYGDYNERLTENPIGPSAGKYKVFRGGGWGSDELPLKVGERGFNIPSTSGNNLGFRLVLELL